MSKKAQRAYVELSHAIADLENPPTCAEPEYRELFFNEHIEANRPMSEFARIQIQQEAEAKIICSFCPVKMLCAEYAILAHEPFGVWGATSPADRKAISSAR